VKIINLISGPRNLSTALMYSFAQNPSIKVLDEPFYAHYLKMADVKVAHPGSQEILKALPNTKQGVLDWVQSVSKTNDRIFIKGMAHHYLSSEPSHILPWQNVILIRHPERLLASFSKVIENPTLDDIGIKKAAALFAYLKNQGKTPLVIDSDELLKNPAVYLEKICKLLQLPFSSAMLSWQKGGIQEDGLWAQYWYGNVHHSTGFAVQKTSSQIMPDRLSAVLDEALIYYNILQNHILKNN
tara:strand:- start:1201 stop:1926 length:726 start_codon:yes stop_codon:yes gene_type:complete